MSDLDSSLNRMKGQKRRLRVLGVVVTAFCLWAGFTWYDQQATLLEKKEELKKVEQLANQEKLENDELKYQVSRLNDRDYIAEIARRDYYLSKPGEIIFLTPDR